MQRSPTRQGALLDLFATNKPGLVCEISNIPGISTANDHDIIVVDSDVKPQISKTPPRKVYKWHKADLDALRRDAALFRDRYMAGADDKSVIENEADISAELQRMMDAHVPHIMSKQRHDVPWLTPELKRACRRKQRLYNKWKRTGNAEDKSRYEDLHTATRAALKRSHWGYINGILQTGLESGDTKPFWRYCKSQRQDNVGVSALKQGGQLFSDRKKKGDILADQFSSVFTDDATDPNRDSRPSGHGYEPIGPLTVTVDGVLKLLRGLNPKKASGPDRVPCFLLKELAAELAPVYTHLFQQSLDTGITPPSWLEAWVSPVFKKGSRCDPANYRPVSLTSVPCKLLEHILCTHIRGHLDRLGVITDVQHGFRARHSCESQLLLTTHDLYRCQDLRDQVDVAVLDFSKAFDTVPHQRLLGKLEFYGITGPVYNWIRAFLTGRTQSVMVEGEHSRKDAVLSGVPQGTVLGPLLFLLFVNDLPECVSTGTRVRLFADDCLVYREVRSQEDRVRLQADLYALGEWSARWGMRFNTSKCEVLQVGTGSRTLPATHFYILNGDVLKLVSSAKYLGVLVTHNLSWGEHINAIASKANAKLGWARRNLCGCPYELRDIAYTSLIRPGLEYSDCLWDPTTKADAALLDQVQHRAARWAKGKSKFGTCSVSALQSELGWLPLSERRRHHRLSTLYKIRNGLLAVEPGAIDLEPNLRPGKQNKYKLPSARRQESPIWRQFVFRTAREWNELPAEVAEAGSLNIFKSRLVAPSP